MGLLESLRRNEMMQVKNISLKLLIICFMVGFGLFFGVDVAQKRLSNSTTTAVQIATPKPTLSPANGESAAITAQDTVVTGPMTAATARRHAQSVQVKDQGAAQAPPPVIVLQDSFVNRLSNQIGDLFRHTASFLLHAVVAFFKLILG
jgi:hypothetical protein